MNEPKEVERMWLISEIAKADRHVKMSGDSLAAKRWEVRAGILRRKLRDAEESRKRLEEPCESLP